MQEREVREAYDRFGARWPSIRVGYEAVVGAGAVVISDVAPMATVVGVPARQVGGAELEKERHAWLLPELARARQIAEQMPSPSMAEHR